MLKPRSSANRQSGSSSDKARDALRCSTNEKRAALSAALFELIALTEPLLGTACVLPQPILTSGEKSSRKSGNNNYAARLLPSAYVNNLIWG